MAHVLTKLTGVNAEVIKQIVTADASKHAEAGLYLEHLWQSVDDANEVLFLFRTTDMGHAKQFIDKAHTQALKENPNANLPRMTFLEEQ